MDESIKACMSQSKPLTGSDCHEPPETRHQGNALLSKDWTNEYKK